MGFGDAFLVADQILEAGLIDETAWKKMKALDDYLSEMSDDPTLWTVDALRDNPRWKEARLRANDILDYLHAPIRPPDPSMV
jgi:hypothetical protein